jgi:hypothetical protein
MVQALLLSSIKEQIQGNFILMLSFSSLEITLRA